MSWTARQRCGFCQRVCQRSCVGSVQHAIGRCPACDWPIYKAARMDLSQSASVQHAGVFAAHRQCEGAQKACRALSGSV